MTDITNQDNTASDGPLYVAPTEQVDKPDASEPAATESDSESEEQPVEQPPKFKAWERARQKPTHIPYERFHEVNSEKVALRTELEQTRARLAELESKSTEIAKVVEPEDLDPADFGSAAEYLAARDKALLMSQLQQMQQLLQQAQAQIAQQQQQIQALTMDIQTETTKQQTRLNVDLALKAADLRNQRELLEMQQRGKLVETNRKIEADLQSDLLENHTDIFVAELKHGSEAAEPTITSAAPTYVNKEITQ